MSDLGSCISVDGRHGGGRRNITQNNMFLLIVACWRTNKSETEIWSTYVFRIIINVNSDHLLNSVNQLIFVTVKCGVLFEVRTEFLSII
jgi:hypothetical protein